MVIKKIVSVGRIVFLFLSLSCAIMPSHHHHHAHDIEVTAPRLHNDTYDIRKYILDRVHSDLKKAKMFGKRMAHAFSGISHYAFDAIPFEFFTDSRAIEAAFKRLEEGAGYIQETKEAFKRNYMVGKKKINQSHLAEFLYNRVVDNINVTAEQKAVLRRDPLKMDEYVRRGIVKREEYMYYTLLNFVVRYYLERELK